MGYTLDELPNEITGVTPASFEPTLDYVAVKVPRFAFEKVPGASTELTTHMKSVGEVLALGRTFGEAFGKAMAGRELDVKPRRTDDPAEALEWLRIPSWDRYDIILDGLTAARPRRRRRPSPPRASTRGSSRSSSGSPPPAGPCPGRSASLDAAALRGARRAGLTDRDIAAAVGATELGVGERRRSLGVRPTYHAVDTCAAEFAALTPYYYSAFESEDELARDARPSIVVLGSGPNRIGQGIEFDYCCVHAAETARELGYAAVMVNCNPETVSTDHGVSDRLYLEPVTADAVLDICAAERPVGVIAQLGGQTPLRLARTLAEAGVPDPGHPARGDRPGRGPRPLRRPPRRARAGGPALGDRPRRRRGPRRRGRGRLPGAGAALVRARRPGDGDLRLARRAARLHRARAPRGRPAGGPLPGQRDRARRGRPLRRRATAGPPR